MLIFFFGGVTFPFTFPKSSCDFGVCHIFRHTHDTSDVIKTVWEKTSRNLRHCQNFMVITHCLGKKCRKKYGHYTDTVIIQSWRWWWWWWWGSTSSWSSLRIKQVASHTLPIEQLQHFLWTKSLHLNHFFHWWLSQTTTKCTTCTHQIYVSLYQQPNMQNNFLAHG